MNTNKYILSNQISLYGEQDCLGFGNDNFYIKEITRDISNKLIIENHYSKKVYNGTYIHLGLFVNGRILGVLQYGYAMNPASCGSVVDGTSMDEYLELNRMWLSDEIESLYPEIRAISFSIKYIKRKFPKIKWIQSFADERCGGFGIVYQACSFNYFGEHTSTFWELDDVVYHNSLMTRNPKLSKSAAYLQHHKERATSKELRQFRYIKFINQKWLKKCLLKEKKYPKHYLEM